MLREREAAEGVKRSGRRPRPSRVPLDEVLSAVFPAQYSNEPFTSVMKSLLEGQSQRSFSQKVPCNQATLSRLLAGRLEPDMKMLERIAAAAEVPPWYFVEWRAFYVGSLITEVLLENPSMGVRSIRALQHLARE